MLAKVRGKSYTWLPECVDTNQSYFQNADMAKPRKGELNLIRSVESDCRVLQEPKKRKEKKKKMY